MNRLLTGKRKKHSEKLDNSNIKSKKKCGYSFGRQVQSSCLGRVKSKLELLEKQDKAFKISKWMPTTKFCPNCGCLNTLTLVDRTFVCDCGYSCDRDVHAAMNMVYFFETYIKDTIGTIDTSKPVSSRKFWSEQSITATTQ